MSRNNTNIFVELSNLLEKYILDEGPNAELFYYHQWFDAVFGKSYSKGMLANHHMGSGKTVLSMSVIDAAIAAGYNNIIFVAPSSLEENISKGIREYKEVTGRDIDREIISFVRRSHTAVKNISKGEREDMLVLDSAELSRNIRKLSKCLVVIDEVHLVMQSISNGSPSMVEFYELLMNSPDVRLLFMTGTLINSRPFELAPMFNLLDGTRIFPETRKQFMEAFWDSEAKAMKNKNKFQNRIAGLVSRIDTRALQLTSKDGKITKQESKSESMFPEQFGTKVIRIPMVGRQIGSYMIRREKELKEEVNRKVGRASAVTQNFGREDKKASTYMVRTRQCSNFAPPAEVEATYAADIPNNEKETRISTIMEKATPEDMISPKFVVIDQIIRKHKRQKGVVFSFFTGIGGTGSLAKFLTGPERDIEMPPLMEEKSLTVKYKCCGYTELTFNNKSPVGLGPKTFAILNGSVPQETKDRIIAIYNDPANDHSEQLAFIMIGSSESQGLDLKSGRWVIMMEPQFIDTIRQQLFTRVVRYGSHLRLDPLERNVQPYILLSIYPENFNATEYIKTQVQSKVGLSSEQLERGLAMSTDEIMYMRMTKNNDMIAPFQEAVDETSIECGVLKKYIPDKNCRMCAPDNRSLFTSIIRGQPPDRLFTYDIMEADPCQEYKTEEVDAVKISVGDIDYYYVKDAGEVTVYYHNKEKDVYEELAPTSPAYKTIIQKIK
jgi:superfamily II DNA or RNA helicase